VLRESLTSQDLAPRQFARILAQSAKLAALKGVEGNGTIEPLGAYRYRDGEHQMLTVTAVITDEALSSRMAGDAIFQQWPFRSEEWDDVYEVNVPDLSPRERQHINSLLSTQDEFQIHQELPFRFDDNEIESLRCFKSYVQHYRRYPSFGRIHL